MAAQMDLMRDLTVHHGIVNIITGNVPTMFSVL